MSNVQLPDALLINGERRESGSGGTIVVATGGLGGAGGKAYGIPSIPPTQGQAYQRVSSGLWLDKNRDFSYETFVHEVGHVLLRHQPPTEIIDAGCRRWDATMELEADWLAGELLVPRRAALEVARQQTDAEAAAQQFGVSRALMEWRLNHSGARKQAARERSAYERNMPSILRGHVR